MIHALAGLVLGALAASVHLVLLWWRSKSFVEGATLRAWLTLPAGLAVVGLCFSLTLLVGSTAPVMFLIGVFALQVAFHLWRVRRA